MTAVEIPCLQFVNTYRISDGKRGVNMNYFDMSESVNKNIEEIDKLDSLLKKQVIDPDSDKGPKQVAELLTFLPEDQRMGAVIGFVMAMLCD